MSATTTDYDVFISYSHATDGEVAAACQRVLQSLRRRLLARPALRVFRDQTSLTSSPSLWTSIEDAIRASRYFILVASPRSAASEWVRREVAAWLEHHSGETLMIVLVDGEIRWRGEDFDWDRTTALPREEIDGVFENEPLWVDLTWVRDRPGVDENDVRLRDAVATVAAPVHGIAKDELESADIRELRRGRRLRGLAVVALSVLLVLALIATGLAFSSAATARDEATTAVMNKVQIEADQLRSRDSALAAQLDLVAHRDRPSADTRNRLTNAAAAPSSQPVDAGFDPVAAQYSPDGRTVALGGDDGSVALWDATTPDRPAPRPGARYQLDAQINSVAFRPDGQVLATASAPNRLSMWTVGDGGLAPLAAVGVGEVPVVAVAFSPTAPVLATGSADNMTRRWDVGDPRRPVQIGPALAGYRGLSFRPDGAVLAVGDEQTNTVNLWNVADPSQTTALGPGLVGHSSTVNATRFSPDGRTLVTGSGDSKVILWDVATPDTPRVLGTYQESANAVLDVAYSADGTTVASASADRTVRLFQVTDPADPHRLGEPLAGHTGFVTALSFAPDGHQLLSAGADGTVRLWELPPSTLLGARQSVRDVRVTLDGRLVAVADSVGNVQLWDVGDSSAPQPVAPPWTAATTSITQLAFTRAGALLAVADNGPTVSLWSLVEPARPSLVGRVQTEPGSAVGVIAFAADDRVLVGGLGDGRVQLWNLADVLRPATLGAPRPVHEGAVTTLATSADGRTVASGGEDGQVRMLDLTDPGSPRPVRQLPLIHDQAVEAVTLSPDGRYVASASRDQTVGLHDLQFLETQQPRLLGHTNSILDVAFSPDGRRIATAGVDTTARLWSFIGGENGAPAVVAPDGEPLAGHTDEIDRVAFLPSAAALLTGSIDGTARLWPLSPETAGASICATTAGALSRAAWADLVSVDRPYDPPCPQATR